MAKNLSSQQSLLNGYFSSEWLMRNPGLTQYTFSGWRLLEKIGADENILDVGCGNNEFKGHRRVTGIDPANQNADQQVCIEEFETDQKFDAVLCLGSINFGDEQRIRLQIEKITRLLAPNGRIFWRCNPGLHDHGNTAFEKIEVFPWDFSHHRTFVKDYGYDLVELEWDSNNRIYAQWQKL